MNLNSLIEELSASTLTRAQVRCALDEQPWLPGCRHVLAAHPCPYLNLAPSVAQRGQSGLHLMRNVPLFSVFLRQLQACGRSFMSHCRLTEIAFLKLQSESFVCIFWP
jgi:hypothetical protein